MAEGDYDDFLQQKSQIDSNDGFAPVFMPSFLFDFQGAIVDWAVRKGRSGVFADCGLGKSGMGLACAENVVRHTNRPVLFCTPIAVGAQMIKEAEKFGIEAHRSTGEVHAGINITNYEKLHLFNPSDFAGMVCDESSILKSYDGKTKAQILEFMRTLRYRFLFTATAAPNDYVELGNSSEALGYLGHMDMLGKFFKNAVGNSTATKRAWGGQSTDGPKWRFKGHAEQPFWKWVCSWARAIRKPSDLGPFDDSRFVLPRLIEREQLVKSIQKRDGFLFAMAAHGLDEQREERRRTVTERCEKAASLVADTGKPAVAWCHLNDEGDLLEKLIPGAVQVSGRDSDDEKEAKFAGFSDGSIRVLVTKPEIGGFGLNWQHCAHQTVFAGYSHEKYYQCIRRSYRFGQKSDVIIDNVLSDGEGEVLENRKRKSIQADIMFEELVKHMRDGMGIARGTYGTKKTETPSWLSKVK